MYENNSENFALLLEESFKTLNTGDIVTGVVRSVGVTEIQVDLPAKVTGIIPFAEVTDDSSVKLCDLYKAGDEITAQAVRVSDVDGIATLSLKKIQRIDNWNKIKAGLESGENFTGKVVEIVKGGVIVSCNFVKVFVPAGQTGVPKSESLDVLQGKVVSFKVIDINEERNRATGSILAVEREERRADRLRPCADRRVRLHGGAHLHDADGGFVESHLPGGRGRVAHHHLPQPHDASHVRPRGRLVRGASS